MKRLVILSLARHDDVNTSATFELAKEFSKSHQVLLIEHPYTWTDLVRRATSGKGWLRIRSTFSSRPLVRKQGNITILVPPAVIPTNFLSFGKWYRRLTRWNYLAVARTVNRWLKKAQWEKYGYINSYNYHFPHLHKHLAGKQVKHVYHCVDPLVKSYTRKHGVRNQQWAVEQADLVISTAPQLVQQWRAVKPSYLVPNGVNYEHFNSPQQLVPRIRSLGRQVIGYFGAIERRIDYDMLITTFRSHPEWDLVLAGPVEETYVPAAIKALPNVHFLGSYSYDQLPSMIYSLDVALIPFKIESAARSIYPLKLYEYLCTGKPIVSTLFNQDLLTPLADKVHLAHDTGDLDEAIAHALAEKDIEKQFQRMAFASTNTWEHRARTFLNHLNDKEHAPIESNY